MRDGLTIAQAFTSVRTYNFMLFIVGFLKKTFPKVQCSDPTN